MRLYSIFSAIEATSGVLGQTRAVRCHDLLVKADSFGSIDGLRGCFQKLHAVWQILMRYLSAAYDQASWAGKLFHSHTMVKPQDRHPAPLWPSFLQSTLFLLSTLYIAPLFMPVLAWYQLREKAISSH